MSIKQDLAEYCKSSKNEKKTKKEKMIKLREMLACELNIFAEVFVYCNIRGSKLAWYRPA